MWKIIQVYPAWLLARMREFADDSDISRSVLQEYGQVIINHDAVQGPKSIMMVINADRDSSLSF